MSPCQKVDIMDIKTRRILVALFILALFVSSQFATQKIASLLEYNQNLDWCIYSASSYKVYFPFAWIHWWAKFGTEGNDWFFTRYGFNIVSVTMTFLGIMILIYRMYMMPKGTTNYGSAHFATLEEIKATKEIDPPGLLSGKGVILGILDDGQLIRDNTKTHILVCAPTRSGKGVGIIIPTLLTWEDSVVVTDIKGENWALTAGWRQKHLNNIVLKFEPTSENSSCYNPFDEVRIRTKYEVRDIQNIVKIFVDPTGKGAEGNNAHWINSSATLLTAVVLHLKYVKDSVNMYDVLEFLYGDRENPSSNNEEDDDEEGYGGEPLTLQDRMQRLILDNYEHDPSGELFAKLYGKQLGGKMHPLVKQYFQAMVDKPDKEFGSILSTLDTVLNTYRDPIISYNMRQSDFVMADLMNHDKPVSLYLVFPPSDIDRVKPLFRVIVEMLYRRNTEAMEFKDGKNVERKHRMLMLLDEFPALGKLETFETAMAYIAGYGIKALIITQDINQIEKLYTTSNSIVSNCQVQVYHTPSDNKTPRFISEKLGKHTIQVKSTSVNGSILNLGGRSHNHSETARDLMTPDEVNTMDKKKELIFVNGVYPILCNKIRFYEIPYFVKRTKIEAPDQTDVINHKKEKPAEDGQDVKASVAESPKEEAKVELEQEVKEEAAASGDEVKAEKSADEAKTEEKKFELKTLSDDELEEVKMFGRMED